jgi:hypothetical protein
LPRLHQKDIEHLKRWKDDDRADEVWNTIRRAALKRGMQLPPRVFIQHTLGARLVAESIDHRRANRERYRKNAEQMMRIAKFLRTPLPNGVLLIPTGGELARGLDEAAKKCREYVAVSRDQPSVVKWTRQSKPLHVFISQLSSDLYAITGRRLDYEVGVLAEIALDEPEIDPNQVIWVRRSVKRKVRKRKE